MSPGEWELISGSSLNVFVSAWWCGLNAPGWASRVGEFKVACLCEGPGNKSFAEIIIRLLPKGLTQISFQVESSRRSPFIDTRGSLHITFYVSRRIELLFCFHAALERICSCSLQQILNVVKVEVLHLLEQEWCLQFHRAHKFSPFSSSSTRASLMFFDIPYSPKGR